MKVKRRWLWVALPLLFCASTIWLVASQSGARSVAHVLGLALRVSGVGSLELKLDAPLIHGISASSGFFEQDENQLASWQRIRLTRPRLRSMHLVLESLEVQGLTITLPPSSGQESSKDWLDQLYEALEMPWLTKLPSFEVAQLRLLDLQVEKSDRSKLAQLQSAKASFAVEKGKGSLELSLQALSLSGFRVHGLETRVHVAPGKLALPMLRTRTNLFEGELEALELDTRTKTWAFERLQGHAVVGAEDSSTIELHAQAPKGQLEANVQAKLAPKLELSSSIRGAIGDLRRLSLQAQTRCDPCASMQSPWDSTLHLRADAVEQELHATAKLQAPEQELGLELKGNLGKTVDAQLAWASKDMSKLAPKLKGTSKLKAECALTLETSTVSCKAHASAQELYPKTNAQVSLDLVASPRSGVVATIKQLRAKAFGEEVQATKGPATVKLHPEGALSLKNLTLVSASGQSQLRASGQRSAQGDMDGQVVAKNWQLALFSAFIPGLDLEGKLDLDVHASYADSALKAKAIGQIKRLRWKDRNWGTLALKVQQVRDKIDLDATLGPTSLANLQIRAQVPSALLLAPDAPRTQRKAIRASLKVNRLSGEALRLLSGLPDLKGQLRAQLKIEGSLNAPSATFQGQWTRGAWKSLRYDQWKLGARLSPGQLAFELSTRNKGRRPIQLTGAVPLRVGDGLLDYGLDKGGSLDLKAQLRALDLAPFASLASFPGLAGKLDARINLNGSLRAPQLESWLSVTRPRYQAIRARDLTASINYRASVGRLSLMALRGGGHVEIDAKVPLSIDLSTGSLGWHRNRPHQLDLIAHRLDAAAFAGLVELPPSLFAHGKLHLQGTPAHHQANAKLRIQSEDPKLKGFGLKADLQVDERKQTLRVVGAQRRKTLFKVRGELASNLVKLASQPQGWSKIPASLQINSEGMDLAILDPWLPLSLSEPGGTLVAHAKAQGPLAQLSWSGHAQLAKGQLGIVPLQQRLQDIHATVKLHGDKLRVSKGRATVGQGSLQFSGAYQSGNKRRGQLRMQIKSFPFRLPGAPRLEISADLRSRFWVKPTDILVKSDLLTSDVQVLELLTEDVKSIPTNANIEFTDIVAPKERRAAPLLTPPTLRLHTKIIKPLRVQGPMVSTSWTGYLNLKKDSEELSGQGKIQATPNGTFELFNNRFVLSRASLEFSETQALMPFLDVRTSTQIDGDEITITARGPASDPKLDFQSSSNATRSQIISSIISGSSTPGEAGNNKLLANAVSALLMESGGSVERFARRLGVENLRFSFGDSLSDTIISAGRWVTPKVYLESKIRAQAPEGKSRVEGHVRYNFRKSWVLEGYLGDRNAGGGGVWWHRPSRPQGNQRAPETKKKGHSP